MADLEGKTNDRIIASREKKDADASQLDLRVTELEAKITQHIFEKEELLAKNKTLEETVNSLTKSTTNLVDENVLNLKIETALKE